MQPSHGEAVLATQANPFQCVDVTSGGVKLLEFIKLSVLLIIEDAVGLHEVNQLNLCDIISEYDLIAVTN